MIGVIGGHGAVGAHAVRVLAGAGPVKIGSRKSSVDIRDAESLARFVTGCSVVVNCAGPSHELSGRVADAALRAGADYVDAGGDSLALADVETYGRSAVFSAGALPGLSGLLPRWMASKVGPAKKLIGYFAVLDRFTATGAEDYLQGVLSPRNRPLGAWRHGPSTTVRRSGVTLPFITCEVSALPYLDEEAEHVARSLSLVEGTWYSVVDGRQLPTALDRARSLPLREAAGELCRATALDVAGRSPYVTFLVQLDEHTCVVRAGGISEVTGKVAGLAALAVLRGEVPVGAHRAAAVLDPAITLHFEPTVVDGAIEDLAAMEDGEL